MSSTSNEWKLKIAENKPGEVEIVGNREGLRFLAKVCASLSDLSDEEAKTAANHYHFAEFFGNLEEGSIKELIVLYKPDL
jgi:hypothetical protein